LVLALLLLPLEILRYQKFVVNIQYYILLIT
jgi:hypothetical protein